MYKIDCQRIFTNKRQCIYKPPERLNHPTIHRVEQIPQNQNAKYQHITPPTTI